MSIDNTTSVQGRIITAFFDTQGAAKKAADDLIAAGIPREHITEKGEGAPPAEAADQGFWESLKDLFLPEEDRSAYSEGLRRGGILLSVRVDEANYTRAMDILDTDGAVNMDEREQLWKSEGWTGHTAETRDRSVGALVDEAPGTLSVPVGEAMGLAADHRDDTAARAAPLGAPATAAAATRSEKPIGVAGGRDEVIPLYEEKLRVGKRDVGQGKVRVRSYVVETPVSEQVSLRKETVSVDRKPVDRPVNAGDNLFQDRVIELDERSEEAVLSKEARVKEEITLRKDVENKTQTVSDTVRHTEVEVDNGGPSHGTAAPHFVAQTDASKILEHMDVISADGQKIGEVDHLDGPDRIKLAKNASPDGQHHMVPFSWIDHVDRHVHLTKTLAEIKAGF